MAVFSQDLLLVLCEDGVFGCMIWPLVSIPIPGEQPAPSEKLEKVF